MSETLFVTGLSWRTDDDSFRAAFEALGTVSRARVLRDPLTGRTLGFGFVTLDRAAEASGMVQAVDGRPVRAHPALERRADGVCGFAQRDARYTWAIFEDGAESLFDREADPGVNLIDEPRLSEVRNRLRDTATAVST